MRSLRSGYVFTALVAIGVILMLPICGHAQESTVSGTLTDPTGAVLPGVTVEAASPVLIEKTRSAVSDSTGQYRIVDLRPGTYDVTFTLTGFQTVKREGIVLSGTFVASVNADMKVGADRKSVV